jgi:hypothetical protein
MITNPLTVYSVYSRSKFLHIRYLLECYQIGWRLCRFIALMLLCGFQPLLQASVLPAGLLERAQQQMLWQHKTWHDLLHYEVEKSSPSGYLSQVDDARFFTAADGKQNPEAELQSTLQAFYLPVADDAQHAQCRFIARFNWLKQQLSKELVNLPQVECRQYNEWRSFVADDQVTLVFPAYHLNSPSSMFGHTLLRLDDADEKHGSDWLSVAVNFGADVRHDDNSLFYAFKGLSGGYPGFFIVEPYFKKIQEYNQKEKRDIWEYPLNLTAQETRRMVEHLWELKEMEFDYYFFDENCSYRLLELLEVARPGIDLTSEYGFSVIPVDTIRGIKAAGLIDDAHYRPSQVTTLENLLRQIKDEHRHYVNDLSLDASAIDTPVFRAIDAEQQKLILQTAYKYLRYKKTDEARDAQSAATSYRLLSALSQTTAADIAHAPPVPSQPEHGHFSKRLNLKLGRENEQNYIEAGVRMAFHSLQDNVQGFLPGAQINMGSLQIRATEDESARLQRLDVVDIFSLTPRTELFDPLSWKILTGLERQLVGDQQRLLTHVSGGVGLAYQPLEKGLVYGLLTLRLERNRGFERTIEAAWGVDSGLLYHFSSGTTRLELSGEEFANDYYRHRAVLGHNYVLSQNHGLHFSLRRERLPQLAYSEFSIAYQYFFF